MSKASPQAQAEAEAEAEAQAEAQAQADRHRHMPRASSEQPRIGLEQTQSKLRTYPVQA